MNNEVRKGVYHLSMENLNGVASAVKEKFHGSVIVCNKLYNLLSSVTDIKLVSNVKEVLDGLGSYIASKQLFDPEQPAKISCHDDELGAVLGLKEFSIHDVPKLLPKFVFPVNSGVRLSSNNQDGNKRKNEELEIPVVKRSRNETMVLYLPPSPASNNLSDSEESCQGYETSVVKDTSDESFYLSSVVESDTAEEDFGIVTVEETFDIEYEVESLASLESDCYSSMSESDSEMDTLKSAIISVICKSDSDMEFWADKSSDEDFYSFDADTSDSDKWECSTCGDVNNPPNNKCQKCFHHQLEWFATEKRTRPKRKNRAKRKRASPSNIFSKEETSNPSQSDGSEHKFESSSQESYCSEYSGTLHSDLKQDSDAKLCFLCYERPANGTIIHAHSKYAHTISCYPCAKKLQHEKKRCPICRRRIHRVVCSVSF